MDPSKESPPEYVDERPTEVTNTDQVPIDSNRQHEKKGMQGEILPSATAGSVKNPVIESEIASLISFEDKAEAICYTKAMANVALNTVIAEKVSSTVPDVVSNTITSTAPQAVSGKSNWPDLIEEAGSMASVSWLPKEEDSNSSTSTTSECTIIDEAQFRKSAGTANSSGLFPISHWESVTNNSQSKSSCSQQPTLSIQDSPVAENEWNEMIAAKEEHRGGCHSSKDGLNSALSAVNSTPNVMLQEYHLKWIDWKGMVTPIVTQNANGPCPLLAILNILLLRRNITFPRMVEIITATQLMEYLCDFIINSAPKNLPEDALVNYEQNFQDAMNILPKLATGLDVNVKFTGNSDFEYTSESIVFDLLNISLYHGWLVDPKEREICRIVDNLSYNQLVDKIIIANGATDENIKSDMFIAEEFLTQTASQLTQFGLQQLIKNVNEEELCTLFRNNHFITLFKFKGSLYQLVTDQGFLTEPNVVWETLHNIEGDSQFVDGNFVLVPPKPSTMLPATAEPVKDEQHQIDQDYLIALSIQEEQKKEWEKENKNMETGQTRFMDGRKEWKLVEYGPRNKQATETKNGSKTCQQTQEDSKAHGERGETSGGDEASPTSSSVSPISTLSDEELARQLQEQEDKKFAEMEQRRQHQQQKHQQSYHQHAKTHSRISNAGEGAHRSHHSGGAPPARPGGQMNLNRSTHDSSTSVSRQTCQNPSDAGSSSCTGDSDSQPRSHPPPLGRASPDHKDKSKCIVM